ncbi:GTPase ObgE [Candidatus Kaiserbacteria bacterium CG10_big_fil_rev_8_21_14_0_10_56_12]|uniref:GTPase Obg n=1 Tax=Candidatus Kaiserbacteria bacterium CG10_big_fil_rev_8_21_14_0_10_56_12 TaxID=1974611 RepID=A0A2H0UBI0_9BACT|nr:MAG: GTPase ObgE [Candidatus Kaiserbacteria bacterium CG10_big_fil_rev_8_21_14_0_10_56_12]
MAFVDQITIHATSGKGGDGVVRWLRTKSNARGGPVGGDGGKGGNVIVVGVRDLGALARYRYEKNFSAENGEAGKGNLKRGANGGDLTLPVPIGTIVKVVDTGTEHEITRENERVVLFRGGHGGLGNARFKSSTHQNPFESRAGKPASGGEIQLTLKLIADVGLVGLPNAGKSSLLNALTHAKSKVGDYPFTTLEPSLGQFNGHLLADIPGLIEGASSGKGLGTRFLKHVERTGILLHLVSADTENPLTAYKEVRHELESFGSTLGTKREIVVLSKIDLIDAAEVAVKEELLSEETGRDVFMVSIFDEESLHRFSSRLSSLLKKE